MHPKNTALTVAAVGCFAFLTACNTPTESPEPQAPAPEMMPLPMMMPEPPPPPVYSPPEVWGSKGLKDLNPDPNILEVELVAGVLNDYELYDGYFIDMYAFNGQIPGPIIQAKVGDEVIIHFTNALPVATTIHWHGLRIPSEMDGTPRVQDPVEPNDTFTYRFTVPDAASFWYHPHLRENELIEKGLYGTFVVHDEKDPEVDLERYIVLDDIAITNDGHAPFLASGHEMIHGRGGNLLLTNGSGELLTHQATQGQTERWRIVNTSNATTWKVSITGADWKVIGSDGGLISKPFTKDFLSVPVGRRYDVLVKYDQAGQVALQRHILVVNEAGDVVEEAYGSFEVDVAASTEAVKPIEWPSVAPIPYRADTREVTLEFDAVNTGNGIQWMINGVPHREEPLFTFDEGDTVLMHLINKLGPEHPFHLHGQFFEVISEYGERGENSPEPGLRDTVLLPGFTSVDIVAYMDNPGQWMVHCHILEHAKLGMMSEIFVTPKP
jgi:FtsP/CotA-like multicopper oxidase with cupredoxin domain